MLRAIVLTGVMIQAVVSLSCNDSLPAYIAPTDFLRASLRITTPPEVSYTREEFHNDISLDPVTITSSAQIFFIDVVSSLDETLQDVPDVSGSVVITSVDIPNLRATIPLTVANFTGTQYNPATRLLTLDPGDTLKLKCTWKYKDDEAKWVFAKANVDWDSEVSPIPPLRGSYERTHVPMYFSVTAQIRLFKATNTTIAPKQDLTLLFHGHVILPP